MKKKKKREYRASALVASLLILTAILVTAISVSLVSIKERNISSNASKSSQAFQSANSGIENVMYEIKRGGYSKVFQISDCQPSGEIENGNYKVQLEDNAGVKIDCTSNHNISDVITIKSVGVDDSGRIQRAISATVNH